MPGLDKTGPQGQGPMTGRGMGTCGRGAGRPRLTRRVNFNPNVTYFKPRGVPLVNLEITELSREELEAMRLKNIDDLDQEQAAQKMNTSQSTFQRILSSAYKKITDAIINGKAISIN